MESNHKEFPKAVKGVLDLRQIEWNQDSISLEGEWEFYWEKFLSPENSFDTKAEVTYITVPSQWQNQKILFGGKEFYPSVYGYATYRLKVLLPERKELNSKTLLYNKELSLLTPLISSSSTVFINGEKILENGKVGTLREESTPFHRRKEISLNLGKTEELDIIVHVSNFYDISVSGIWDSFHIGFTKKLQDSQIKKSWITFILFSALWIMGLYHLVLYVNRRKDSSALYFGLFCVLMSFRELAIGHRFILDIFPNFPFWIVHKLEFIPFYGGGILFIFFMRSLFPLEFSNRIFKIIIFITMPAFVILLLAPVYIYSYTRTYYQIATLFSLSYSLKVIMSGIINKRMGARLFLSATLVFFITIINDILNARGLIHTPSLATFGLLTFVFFQAVILSRRFTNAFVDSERLSDELRKNTELIEKKIEERVKDQQKYYQILQELSKSDTMSRLGFDAALCEITKLCAETLKVERSSIWKIDETTNHLLCLNLFKSIEKEYESGMSFAINDFPIYFSFFKEGEILSAPNVYEHPNEIEFNEIYHRLYNIQSLLEMPVHSNGNLLGILVCEKLETKKEWTKEEENFISSISSIVANLFESNERKKAFLKLEKAKLEMEALNELTRNINSVSTLTDVMSFVMYYLETDFGFKDFWLVLVDKPKDEFYTFSFVSNSLPEENILYFKDWRTKINQNLGSIYNAYFVQEHQLWNLVDRADNLSEEDQLIQSKTGWKYFLHFPLLIYGETIGVLSINKPIEDNSILPDELDRLQKFSDQISGSVFNAGLLKETEEARTMADIEKGIAIVAQKEAEKERQKSEKLLLNILPEEVAKELKEKGSTEPVLYESVSVLFTDFKGFTQIAENLSPAELVKELDSCFIQFDKITERYRLEKLKTIGDSYMCAGGIPKKNRTHAIDAVLAALEIQNFMNQMKEIKEIIGLPYWELRLGIHTGSLVAGVIGEKKFAYDVWGDTVNTASRMESSGTPGRINISGATYEIVKDFFICEYRGRVNAKNKGEVDMYYVLGIKEEMVSDSNVPNGLFWEQYGRILLPA